MAQTKAKMRWIRMLVLTFFLAVVTFAAFRHQIVGGGPAGAPPVDALCPFGGLETIYSYIAGGTFLKRTNLSNLVLLGGTVVLAVVFGRFFCGWICALGWMQELAGKLGKIIFKKRFVIPVLIDRPLRYLKYLVLLVILFFTWRLADLVVRPFDPFAAYAHLPAGLGEVLAEFLIGFLVLVGSLILSLFFDRFFCKYLCPMGAFLGIVDRIPVFRIKRNTTTCIHCNKCSKVCPVNIPVAEIESVSSPECISCFECVAVCPTGKDTMTTTVIKKPLHPLLVGVVGLVIYLGIIGIAHLAGIWQTQPATLSAIVEKNGTADPSSIRGFMTLKDISETFKLPIETLYSALGLTMEQVPATTKMKELKEFDDKIDEDAVRTVVAGLVGQKSAPATQEKSLDGADPALIRGSTTVKEICDTYGITKEALYSALGITRDLPDTATGKDIKALLQETNPAWEMDALRDVVSKLKTK